MAKRLPKIGLEAILEMKAFERDQKRYTDALRNMEKQTQKSAAGITSASKNITKVFDDFVVSALQADNTSGQFLASLDQLQKVWEKAGQPGIDVEKFNKGIDEGKTILDAFNGSLEDSGKNLLKKESALKLAGAAATIFSTAIGTSIAVVKDAVNEYTEFAEQVRQIRFELGVSAEEASGWVRASEAAGLSSTTLNRAMTQLSGKMLDYQLRAIEGKDTSSAFTRALDSLDVSMTNTDGTLRSAADVMDEVNEKLRQLGPGAITSGEAVKIYGIAGRDMVKVIHDQSGSMEDLTKRAIELGAVTTELGQERYEAWRAATGELQLATQGIKNYIAMQWIPVLTELAKIATELINTYRQLNILWRAGVATAAALASGMLKLKDASAFYAETVRRLASIESDAARREQEIAQARNEAAQNALLAAQAEEEAARQRAEALAEIEQDRLDLIKEFGEKEEDIRRKHIRKMLDLMEEFRRDDIITAMKQAGQREDLWMRHQHRLANIEKDTVAKQKEIRDELAKELSRFDEDAARKREKLLNKHLDNMWKIRNRYLDTVQEAARNNDAVAVVRAMRVAAQANRDERHRYAREQSELEKDLAIKRKRIQEDAQEKEAEAQKERDNAVEKENQKYMQQLELLEAKFAREREITKLQRQWEIDDLNTSKARALEDLKIWYRREQDELNAQMAALGNVVAAGVEQVGMQVAQATSRAIQAIGAAAGAAVGGAGAGAARSLGIIGGRTATMQPTGTTIDQWFRRTQPGGHRAEGGVDVVNRPTSFVAGDRGAEVAAFIPLHNIHHTFGRMGVDFNGLPSGADTSQVEGIVYDVMVQVARSLVGGRK